MEVSGQYYYAGENGPSSLTDMRLGGPTDGLDAEQKRKNSIAAGTVL